MPIYTDNCTIHLNICKALDKAIYSGRPITPYALSKANIYRFELLDRINRHDCILADKVKSKGLYYLYSLVEMIAVDEGNFINERMHANAHTAHEQLKNWK